MNKLYSLIFLLLILGLSRAQAQIDTNEFKELDEIDIYSLLKESVFKKVVVRFEESPGNLTEISHEEFANRGARDLMDVMRMIPGFEFAQNINGQIGMGYQGMWAQQNKITILIDNVAMNDGLQGGFAAAQRISIDMIEKIQIVKGAGSIQFQGANTMTTINIITRSGDKMGGARIALSNGTFDSTFARRGISLVMGDNLGKNKYWSVIGSYNSGKVTNIGKINPTSPSWEQYCNLSDLFLFAKLKLNKWDIKYLLNNYNSQASIRQSTVKSLIQNFQVSNEFKIKKTDLAILPVLNLSAQLPMNWIVQSLMATDTNNMMQTKAQARLMLKHTYEDNKIKSLSYFGIDYNWEQNTLLQHKTKLNPYTSTSLYAQNVFQKNLSRIYINRLLVKTGIKADIQSGQNINISPKIGIEYYYKNLQINAFAGRYGINPNNYGNYLNANLKQEQIQSAQFRVNYIFKSSCNIAANLFMNKSTNMISFMEKDFKDTFVNIATAGSQGIELEFNWKLMDGLHFKSYYTYFQKANKDSNQYSLESGNSGLLGFASHKLYASLQYNLVNHYWINVNGQYYSKITGIESGDLKQQNPLLMLDLTMSYSSPKSPIEVQTGIYNILNHNFKYFQAYNNSNNIAMGINNPVPGGGRELFLKIIFKLSFYDNDHQSYNYSNPIIF